MSSTEIVHGASTTPQRGFAGDNNNHSASYAAQAQALSTPAAVSVGVSGSSTTETDNKRFTTSYGMVVWPTLPGLSSSSSPPSSAPVPAPGTQMSSAPADLVHHHSPSEATAAPRTAQTLLPGTMANHPTDVVSDGGCGQLQYSTSSSTMLLRAACDACHRMKRKCDGKHPCARCERRGRDCLYSYKQKSGPPKGSKRKLIEEEDDLPENRPSKPTLRYHLGGAASNAGEGNFAATTAGSSVQPVVAAPPVVATWPGSSRSSNSSSNKGSNPTNYDGVGDAGDAGAGDYRSHPASSSSAPIESAGQFTQASAQQFVQMPAQSPMPPHTQQCSPVPASTPPAPVLAMAPAPASPLRPSPEARAAAAAAVAASRMNALTPVAPTLASASLQYMLQPPPAALPGLSGGGGGVVVGQGTAASLAPHPQYGTVYHQQYPPEVYAVYLAELRQRSCGSSSNIGSNVGSISSSRSSGNGNSISGNITGSGSNTTVNVPSNNNDITPASAPAAACTAAAPVPPVSGPQDEIPALVTAAAEAAQTVARATSVGPHTGTVTANNGGPTATTQPATTTGWSPPPVSAIPAGHLLPGIGGNWGGSKGSVATSSGNDGTGGVGGVEPDAATPAHVAKMPEEGSGGVDSGGYYAGKAAAAAASSAALAAAVAAAIARSSPMVDEDSCKTIDALTCSMAPSDGGGSHPEVPAPLSPAKNNHFSVAASKIAAGGGDGRAEEVSAKIAGAQAASASAASAPSPAGASTEREENELAAANLLLYGARGQGSTATCTGSTGAAGDGKVDEGQENNFQHQQQHQQQQQGGSLTT